jgi:hypothetical protein
MKKDRSLVISIARIYLLIGLLLTIGGLVLMYVGEWLARRGLALEIQTTEAIQKNFDGAACLPCTTDGGVLILMGIGLAIISLLALSLFKLFRVS